jgi:hypothetical protein
MLRRLLVPITHATAIPPVGSESDVGRTFVPVRSTCANDIGRDDIY